MKWLIVNADDLGVSPHRNKGILEAHLRGIVTSASVMAFGAGFKDALRLLKDLPSPRKLMLELEAPDGKILSFPASLAKPKSASDPMGRAKRATR